MEIDVVDVYDDSLLVNEVTDIRAQGREPVMLNQSTTNAVARIVELIIQRAGATASIQTLRFHGHGEPGAMGVDSGEENYDSVNNGIAVSNLTSISHDLARLRPYFAARARVEMHGCNLASGRQGASLLRSLSALWGVPVSGGSRTQIGGRGRTLRFEGPVYTAYPNGRLIRRQNDSEYRAAF